MCEIKLDVQTLPIEKCHEFFFNLTHAITFTGDEAEVRHGLGA